MALVSNDEQESQHEYYHLYPKQGLLNDPNGLVYFKGKYHVFFQLNPKACDHTYKEWGHFVSDDLRTWERLNSALIPSEYDDQSGIYSGAAFVKDDKLYVFYTGNRRNEEGVSVASTQLWAVSEDGIHFDKLGPLVPHPDGFTKDVRDPMVWQGKNGHYFMVLGAQTTDKVGDILIYESVDFTSWTLRGSLIENELLDVRGYMIECPALVEVDGYQILIFSPQGLKPNHEFHEYENIHNTGYVLGRFDEEAAHFMPESDFVEMDKGFEFYAPQVLNAPDGRKIMWGWAGIMTPEREKKMPTIEKDGWVHVLTIPRELHVVKGHLTQTPIDEIKDEVSLNPTNDRLAVGQYRMDTVNNWVRYFGNTLTVSKVGNQLIMSGAGGIEKRMITGDVDVVDLIVDVDIIELFTDQNRQAMAARYF